MGRNASAFVLMCLCALCLAVSGCGGDTETGAWDAVSAVVRHAPWAPDHGWALKVVVRTDPGMTRVWATGDVVDGEYDLYRCGSDDEFGTEIWESVNNAACVHGNDNYNLGGRPTFPFTVTVYTQNEKRTQKYVRTVTDYETLTRS